MRRSLKTTDFQRLPFPEPHPRAIHGAVQFLVPSGRLPLEQRPSSAHAAQEGDVALQAPLK